MVDDPRSIFHLRLVGQLHGQQTQNGFWFREASMHTGEDDDATNCAAIITRFNARVMPYFKDFANTEWHYIALVCATMKPRHGPIVEAPFESGSGNQPNDSLPGSVAAVLSLRTGFGGRNNLGRLFIAGVSEGDHQAGELLADSLARLQGIGDQLISSFRATDPENLFHYGVYSHVLGDVAPPPGQSGRVVTSAGFRPITSTVGRRRLGTQRHRLIGHGS